MNILVESDEEVDYSGHHDEVSQSSDVLRYSVIVIPILVLLWLRSACWLRHNNLVDVHD